MEAPVPVIAQTVIQLDASRNDKQNSARAIAMMRRGSSDHPTGPTEAIAKERREVQVDRFPAELAGDSRSAE